MLTPKRSFTLPKGFWLSSFATTSAPHPSVTRLSRTSGVCPISSVTSFAIFITTLVPFRTGFRGGLPFPRRKTLGILAEASGGRTHRRRGDPPPAGFEDRDDHRTACASGKKCRGQLFRLRHDPYIRLRRLPATRVLLLRLFIRNIAADDDVFARLPVRRRRDFVFGRELNRIDDPENFVEVPARAHGITKLQLNFFVRTDHKYSAYGGIVRGRAALGRASTLGGQHAVELGDLQLRIADHRVVHLVALSFLNIDGPLAVTAHWVHAESDNFGVALGKFRLQARHIAEFRGAYRSEVLGMRKQNCIPIAN